MIWQLLALITVSALAGWWTYSEFRADRDYARGFNDGLIFLGEVRSNHPEFDIERAIAHALENTRYE